MDLLQTKKLRLIFTLVGVLVLFTFNAWFLNFNFQQVSEQQKWMEHTNNVLNALELTISTAKDAETGARGYLLTGSEDHLQPFLQSTTDLPLRIAHLKLLTADNPEQLSRVTFVEDTIRKRLTLLNELIEKFRNGRSKVDPRSIQYNEGKVVMDSLRKQIDSMKTTETELLKKRSEETEKSRSIFLLALILTSIASASVIGFTFIQIFRNQYKSELAGYEKEALARLSSTIAGDISPEKVAQAILNFLTTELKILAGKVYLKDGGKITPISSFATEDSDNSNQNINSSLINSAFQQNAVFQVQDIPGNYWKLSSGLGGSLPSSLTFLPFFISRKANRRY